MLRCKFIILFKDSGAKRNLKITYSSTPPHSPDLFTIAKGSSRTTEQIYKRNSYFLVVSKQIIVAFIT